MADRWVDAKARNREFPEKAVTNREQAEAWMFQFAASISQPVVVLLESAKIFDTTGFPIKLFSEAYEKVLTDWNAFWLIYDHYFNEEIVHRKFFRNYLSGPFI